MKRRSIRRATAFAGLTGAVALTVAGLTGPTVTGATHHSPNVVYDMSTNATGPSVVYDM